MRVTFLDKILNFNNKKMMKKWSERNKKGGYYRIIVNKIISLLQLISGNEIDLLLTELINIRKLNQVDLSDKCNIALKNISKLYIETKPKKRHHYIRSLRLAGLNYKQTNSLGFKTGKYLWKSCLDPTTRKHGARVSIKNQQVYQKKQEHMLTLSSIAANRFLKKDLINAYHRETTLTEAYNLFVKNGENISFTAFVKNVHQKFKKFRKATDLCQYCEYGKHLANELKKIMQEYGFSPEETYHELSLENVDSMHNFFLTDAEYNLNVEEMNVILKKIFDLREIAQHKDLAKRQRDCYNSMRNNKELLKDRILIVIDFKAKIKLAEGPRQLNNEFYEENTKEKERLLLSFGIYFLNDSNEIKCLNADLVLNDCTETSFVVINCFKFLRTQQFFKNIEKKDYIIW